VVDVASRESVRAFAAGLAACHRKLDVLVNNAGIWSERRRVGPDGVGKGPLGPHPAPRGDGRHRQRRPEEGVDTVVWLAASPEVEGRSGRFWIDRRERQCRFRDEAGEEALWALCRAMTR